MTTRPKVAVCFSGHIRLWEHIKENFRNVICKNADVDLYVQTYRQNHYSPVVTLNDEVYTDQQIIKMFEGFNLVDIIIEDFDQDRMDRESEPYKHLDTYKIDLAVSSDSQAKMSNVGSRIMAQLRSIHRSYELFKKHNRKYDVLIKSRFDVLYLTYPNWTELQDGKLHYEVGATGGFPHDLIIAGTPDVVEKTCMLRYSNLPLLFDTTKVIPNGNCPGCPNIIPCCDMNSHSLLAHSRDYYGIETGSFVCHSVLLRSPTTIWCIRTAKVIDIPEWVKDRLKQLT